MRAIAMLIIISFLAGIAYAFEDWSERFDDFFSGIGSPSCAQEGEILQASACCGGLQEQYSEYSGETICVRPQEPVETVPTETEQERCYDDLYCQYVRGEGWLCGGNNQCYYSANIEEQESGITYYPQSEREAEIIEQEFTKTFCSDDLDCQYLYQDQRYRCNLGVNRCYYSADIEGQESGITYYPGSEGESEIIESVETRCYDDLYCKYQFGRGWLCDQGNFRCYYTGMPAAETATSGTRSFTDVSCEHDSECKKFGPNWFCDLKEDKCFSPIYPPKLYCTDDYECREILGKDWECKLGEKQCFQPASDPTLYYCTKDSDCIRRFGKDWICNPYEKECLVVSYVACHGSEECRDKLGVEWSCDRNELKCVRNTPGSGKVKSATDILFVPLNFDMSNDEEFIRAVNLQLGFFRQAAPDSCLPKVAFLRHDECRDSCYDTCKCIDIALNCAAKNDYVAAKKIVGIVNGNTLKTRIAGCAIGNGDISAVVSGYKVTVTQGGVEKDVAVDSSPAVLAHELGHNFGLCHVSGDDPKKCDNPEKACGLECPNRADCYISSSERAQDIMTYCPKKEVYGPVAYNRLALQCGLSSGTNQQVIQAYVTVNRDGTAQINSVHISYGTLDEEQGDYVLEAFDDDGKKIAEADFDVEFLTHGDAIDESGNMYSEPVELDKVSEIVEMPYLPQMDEIKIESHGREVASVSLSDAVREKQLYAETSKGSRQLALLPEGAARAAGIQSVSNVGLAEQDGEPVYTIEGKKPGYFLFIPWEATVFAKIDATNGDVLALEKPWWFWG